jgi:hypothetical protein
MLDNKWEYAEIYASMWKEELHIRITFPDGDQQLSPHKDVLVILNELGKDGWELISAMGRGRRAGEVEFSQILYLKRLAKVKITPGSGPLRGTR